MQIGGASAMRIGDKLIGHEAPRPYVIAEVASSHEGKVDRAKAITRAALLAGADAVKYQIWSLEQSTTPDHADYAVLADLEFTAEQWIEIMMDARASGAAVLVDVDDEAGLQLA